MSVNSFAWRSMKIASVCSLMPIPPVRCLDHLSSVTHRPCVLLSPEAPGRRFIPEVRGGKKCGAKSSRGLHAALTPRNPLRQLSRPRGSRCFASPDCSGFARSKDPANIRFPVVCCGRVTRPQHTTGNRIFAGSFERANPEQSGDAKQRDPRGRLSCRRGFRGVKAAWSPRLDFAPHFFPPLTSGMNRLPGASGERRTHGRCVTLERWSRHLTGGIGMSEQTDAIFMLRHANEFTDIENSAIVYVLRGWFASLAGIPGAL